MIDNAVVMAELVVGVCRVVSMVWLVIRDDDRLARCSAVSMVLWLWFVVLVS